MSDESGTSPAVVAFALLVIIGLLVLATAIAVIFVNPLRVAVPA